MLDTKKVVIIGAAGLLGTELVKALLSNNAEVIALDKNLDAMNKRFKESDIDISSKNISFHSMDITNENDVKDFFFKFTDIDGAVNCSCPRNSNYGAKFFNRIKEVYAKALMFGSGFMVIAGVIIYLSSSLVISLFTTDPEVIKQIEMKRLEKFIEENDEMIRIDQVLEELKD